MVRDAPMGVLHGSRDTTGRKQSPQSHGAHSEEGKMPLHFTPHCLRHTYASLMLQQGEPVTYVQRQLGHASIQLTVDTYGKWLPMGNKAAVDKLDGGGVTPKVGRRGSKAVARRGSGRKRGSQVIENAGGPTWDRTRDRRIMSPLL